MFDWYEPVPALACAGCGLELADWQGKDGPCLLFRWRQGVAAPVGQDGDDDWLEADPSARRLPRTFEIYASCVCQRHTLALGIAPDGVWQRTSTDYASAARRGPTGKWLCACCENFTLTEEPPGSHEICPVCRWEDDAEQAADASLAHRSNALSLHDARIVFRELGASNPDERARVRPPRDDERP